MRNHFFKSRKTIPTRSCLAYLAGQQTVKTTQPCSITRIVRCQSASLPHRTLICLGTFYPQPFSQMTIRDNVALLSVL
jgi:hypothetical protein